MQTSQFFFWVLLRLWGISNKIFSNFHLPENYFLFSAIWPKTPDWPYWRDPFWPSCQGGHFAPLCRLQIVLFRWKQNFKVVLHIKTFKTYFVINQNIDFWGSYSKMEVFKSGGFQRQKCKAKSIKIALFSRNFWIAEYENIYLGGKIVYKFCSRCPMVQIKPNFFYRSIAEQKNIENRFWRLTGSIPLY